MAKSNNIYLGPYLSKGSANGRPLFQGPKGGKFYISATGNFSIRFNSWSSKKLAKLECKKVSIYFNSPKI